MLITLAQTYDLDRIRLFLENADDRYYQYQVEVSNDGSVWTKVVDKTWGEWRGWQEDTFSARPVRYIRITGTYSSSGNQFRVVEVEAYPVNTAATASVQVPWQADDYGMRKIFVSLDPLKSIDEISEGNNLAGRDFIVKDDKSELFKGMAESGGTGIGSPFYSWTRPLYILLDDGDTLYLTPSESVNNIGIYDFYNQSWEYYSLGRDYQRGEIIKLDAQTLEPYSGRLVQVEARFNANLRSFHAIKKNQHGGFVEGGSGSTGSSFSQWSSLSFVTYLAGDQIEATPAGTVDRLSIYSYSDEEWIGFDLHETIHGGEVFDLTPYLDGRENSIVQLKLMQGTNAVNFHLVKTASQGGMVEGGDASAGSSFSPFVNDVYTFIVSDQQVFVASDHTFNGIYVYDYQGEDWSYHDIGASHGAGHIAEITSLLEPYTNKYVRIQLYEGFNQRALHLLKKRTSGGLIEG